MYERQHLESESDGTGYGCWAKGGRLSRWLRLVPPDGSSIGNSGQRDWNQLKSAVQNPPGEASQFLKPLELFGCLLKSSPFREEAQESGAKIMSPLSGGVVGPLSPGPRWGREFAEAGEVEAMEGSRRTARISCRPDFNGRSRLGLGQGRGHGQRMPGNKSPSPREDECSGGLAHRRMK